MVKKPDPATPVQRFIAIIPAIWTQYDGGVVARESVQWNVSRDKILWQGEIGPKGKWMHSAPDEFYALVSLPTPEVPRHYLWDLRTVNMGEAIEGCMAVRWADSTIRIIRTSKAVKYGFSVGLPGERAITIGDNEVLDGFDHVRYHPGPLKVKQP